jgi:hypothetical protein
MALIMAILSAGLVIVLTMQCIAAGHDVAADRGSIWKDEKAGLPPGGSPPQPGPPPGGSPPPPAPPGGPQPTLPKKPASDSGSQTPASSEAKPRSTR